MMNEKEKRAAQADARVKRWNESVEKNKELVRKWREENKNRFDLLPYSA
jgi:hypothetical protein|tara:strand:- start:1694 stop:1840 length:147 start_codon:yes stop_codon:yes gene_type:complete